MRAIDILNSIGGFVVFGFGLFLIGLALQIIIRPSAAERFLNAFASSAFAHYTEQSLRVLVGVSLVNYARAMSRPDAFRIFGWAIIVSSLALLLIPWQWHQKLAKRMMPLVYRHMNVFAFGAFGLGAFVLYGASHGFSHHNQVLPPC